MGAVQLRCADEIARIRDAAHIVYEVLVRVVAAVAPGVSTAELDAIAERSASSRGARPAFKGYHGYPASLCISVNDEVVHGIPSPDRTLRSGDLVSLDFGVSFRGWFGDAACTVGVGPVSAPAQALLGATRRALGRAVEAAVPGGWLGDLGHAVQASVEPLGLSVVREFAGHGIGRALHEAPPVPNLGTPRTGLRLRPGMVLAIEPMVNAGSPAVRVLADGWTAVTVDGSLSAHFEHTVAVTAEGPVVLSLPPGLPDLGARIEGEAATET